MKTKYKKKILVVVLIIFLGLITTAGTDLISKSTTSPSNVIYSADYVLYFHAPLVSITQSKKRGFPFVSQTKVVIKYTDEVQPELPASKYNNKDNNPNFPIMVQLPSISSTGSNSFTRILLTWQFYADVLTWTIVWSLLGYSIKSIKHKKA